MQNDLEEDVTMEFILNLDEDMVYALIDDARIRACEKKSECKIELTKRILNKQYFKGRLTKFCIVSVTGKDEHAIRRCLVLIERIFPEFRNRKEYTKRAPLTIYTKEYLPENADLYNSHTKTGACRHMYGDVPLKSPFATHVVNRPMGRTPWKVTADERLGNVDPAHLLDVLQYYKPGLNAYTRKVHGDHHEFSDESEDSDDEEDDILFGNDYELEVEDKEDINTTFGRVAVPKSASFMCQTMLNKIPKTLSDPLVIVFDGKEVIMAGSAALLMKKTGKDDSSSGLQMDLCSAAYRISIVDDFKKNIN